MSDSHVIARRFRPKTFDEVVGQEAITRTLINAIATQRIHHAYLFAGARGVGKTTTARILAKALNCSTGVTTEPCGVCPSCVEIANSSSIDVLEIDAASNTGVDNVRDSIISTVSISPARDRYRIFIIDEVHQLSSAAFNALLKTLEEPPPRVLFILATTEMHKVPETILSRCQIFEFRTIPSKKIFEQLRRIAKDLDLQISDSALLSIARAGEGSMRDAESALDQVYSFAGKAIAPEDVSAALGLVDTETLNAITSAIAEEDSLAVLRIVDEIVSRGYDLRNLCRELMTHIRALLVMKIAGVEHEMLEIPPGEGDSLLDLAGAFSEQDLIRFFSILTKTEQDIRLSSQPRFQLEIGLMKLLHSRRLYLVEDALNQLKELQARLGGSQLASSLRPATAQAKRQEAGSVNTNDVAPASRMPRPPQTRRDSEGKDQSRLARPSAKPMPPTEPAFMEDQSLGDSEEPDSPLNSPAPSRSEPGEVGLIKAVLHASNKMMLLDALDRAECITIQGDSLVVSLQPDDKISKSQIEGRDGRRIIEEACYEALGRKLTVSTKSGSNQAPAPADQDETAKPADRAEAHPAVRALVDRFHGEIVDITKRDG